MSEKLTINHLCGYLPYGLKICYRVLDLENGDPTTGNPEDRLKDCIMVMNGARLDRCLLPETDRWYDKNSIFKPLIIPISQFTDEQWVEVFKAGFDNSEIDHSLQFSELVIYSDCVMVKYRGVVLRYAFKEVAFHHWPISFNQLAAFNKIYSLHGDIHGLIEKGLAVSKLDCEK